MNTLTETKIDPELEALLPQLAAAWAVPTLREQLLELCRPERVEMALAFAAYEEIDRHMTAIPPEEWRVFCETPEGKAAGRAWAAAGERKLHAWGAWYKTQPPPAEDEETEG
jgi:hypothetical protein